MKLTTMEYQHERGLVTTDGKQTLYDVTGVNKYQLKPFISATGIYVLVIAWPAVGSLSLSCDHLDRNGAMDLQV